jgi:DNA-binding HxlR family transcriptional regulator
VTAAIDVSHSMKAGSDSCSLREREQALLLMQTIQRIGDKWTMLVMSSLSTGPMRFNALMRYMETVSHRMLTLTLRGMERNGLVARHVFATVPPKVEYCLTPLGHSLIEPLNTLSVWTREHQGEMKAAQSYFDSQYCAN